MKKAIVPFMVVVMAVVLVAGSCFAAESLEAKAAKIRVGRGGDTEVQVKAIMGEPRVIETGEKFAGMRTIKFRRLKYGPPDKEIIIIIDGDEGYIRGIK